MGIGGLAAPTRAWPFLSHHASHVWVFRAFTLLSALRWPPCASSPAVRVKAHELRSKGKQELLGQVRRKRWAGRRPSPLPPHELGRQGAGPPRAATAGASCSSCCLVHDADG